MGRAARWLRSLWGGKKENKENRDYSNYGGGGEVYDRKEKKRWSFTKSARDSDEVALGQNASTAAAVEATWFRSFYSENEKDQSKHAIAVAAATKAAASAAVAAAHAAVAVVRLTNQGRGATVFGSFHEREAAVRIQTAFRGYLAKKALRALKALVKLQALVRGYLVRKQAAATLHSMQALIRVQAAARAQRARNLLPADRRFHPEIRHRMSLERFDEARSEHLSSSHSRRLSASLDSASNGYDRSPKIVEVDTCRPKSRSSRRSSPSLFDPADDSNSNSMSSPLPHCQFPAQFITIPDCRNFQEYDWSLPCEKCRFSATAQSTPRYMSSSYNAPVTPAKSVCGADGALRRLLNDPNGPNYMSSTQSFEAKVRSQSAPKQRPEPVGTRKRLPLSEVMLEARASLSGAGMQRSCNRVQEAFSFKSAVVGKLDRSSEFSRNTERDLYLHRKW